MAKANQQKKEKDDKKEYLSLIGTRIKTIRLEENLNQADIEEILNIPNLSLHRIEFGIGGTIPAFLLILEYFSDKGYNTRWILEKDNKNELKKKDQIYTFDLEKDKIGKTIKKIKSGMDSLNELIKNI